MLSLLFGFLGSIKTVLIGTIKWCAETVGGMMLSNIFGTQA